VAVGVDLLPLMANPSFAPGATGFTPPLAAGTYILEGSVQKSGDTMRVNVQLIKAGSDSHLWADTFDRKMTDIFSVAQE